VLFTALRRAASRAILLLLFVWLGGGAAFAASPPCPAPGRLVFETERQIRRSDVGFTEGLEIHNGALYESTGDFVGHSQVNRIDLATGQVTVLVDAGRRYFGEGLTIFSGRIYQMTWREHQVFVFDLEGRRLQRLHNPREGWGLTHDSARLIASDGSDKIFFLSPDDFSTLDSLTVRLGADPVPRLNELEYVDNVIYANVFEDWRVLRISSLTGCVEAVADLSGLLDQMRPADQRRVAFDRNFVLNGIAHDPRTGQFVITGKDWPVLFVGRFRPA
jgi:glutamine cyclotransferase